MSSCVIDKYIAKKVKDMLEYAKILERIITVDNNKMWHTKKEFNLYAETILKSYAEQYYFDNNTHRDNPIDYSNDNINNILKVIIDYLKKEQKINLVKECKNETFLLSVILCTVCYLDISTNSVDGNITDTKAKFKKLVNYFKKTKILNISSSKFLVKDLFDLLSKKNKEDTKMFASISSEDCYNEYIPIDNKTYEVRFSYNINELKSIDKNITNKVIAKYESKFNEISIELLTFQILRELISNEDMHTYIIKSTAGLKKVSVMKMLASDYIKKYIKIEVSNETENEQLIEKLKSNGIEYTIRKMEE